MKRKYHIIWILIVITFMLVQIISPAVDAVYIRFRFFAPRLEILNNSFYEGYDQEAILTAKRECTFGASNRYFLIQLWKWDGSNFYPTGTNFQILIHDFDALRETFRFHLPAGLYSLKISECDDYGTPFGYLQHLIDFKIKKTDVTRISSLYYDDCFAQIDQENSTIHLAFDRHIDDNETLEINGQVDNDGKVFIGDTIISHDYDHITFNYKVTDGPITLKVVSKDETVTKFYTFTVDNPVASKEAYLEEVVISYSKAEGPVQSNKMRLQVPKNQREVVFLMDEKIKENVDMTCTFSNLSTQEEQYHSGEHSDIIPPRIFNVTSEDGSVTNTYTIRVKYKPVFSLGYECFGGIHRYKGSTSVPVPGPIRSSDLPKCYAVIHLDPTEPTSSEEPPSVQLVLKKKVDGIVTYYPAHMSPYMGQSQFPFDDPSVAHLEPGTYTLVLGTPSIGELDIALIDIVDDSATKIPVTNQAGSDQVRYHGTDIDLTSFTDLFVIDPNAGRASHSIEREGTTGKGYIYSDSRMLKVLKAGIFKISLITDETATHEESEKVTATLEVLKGLQEAPANLVARPVTESDENSGAITGLKKSTVYELSKDQGPFYTVTSNDAGEITELSAGNYRIRFPENDLYEQSPETILQVNLETIEPTTTPTTAESTTTTTSTTAESPTTTSSTTTTTTTAESTTTTTTSTTTPTTAESTTTTTSTTAKSPTTTSSTTTTTTTAESTTTTTTTSTTKPTTAESTTTTTTTTPTTTEKATPTTASTTTVTSAPTTTTSKTTPMPSTTKPATTTASTTNTTSAPHTILTNLKTTATTATSTTQTKTLSKPPSKASESTAPSVTYTGGIFEGKDPENNHVRIEIPPEAFPEQPQVVVQERTLENQAFDVKAYDISFLLRGAAIQPNAPVTVYLPLNGLDPKKVKLYHETLDQEVKSFVIDQGRVRFNADQFSLYILAAPKTQNTATTATATTTAKSQTPATGEVLSSTVIWAVFTLSTGALLISVQLLKKRKRPHREK